MPLGALKGHVIVGGEIRDIQCMLASGILSHMPRWPALSDTASDSHLDLVKDSNSPDDLEAEARKQRDAPHVGRSDASHERLFPYTELVACVRKEQAECRMCASLTAVGGLCREVRRSVCIGICLLVKEERR